MSNLSKRFKKELALILAVTMAFGSMQLPGMMSKVEATDVVTPVEFGTPVLKMGVLSDVHLAYGYDTSESIQNKVKQYVKAAATLNKMAGDKLDVLMLAGDYTGYGNYEQAKTFSTASAAIMKHINSIKGNNTQFFMTYGNHDTEWNGQMDYAGWENVLRGDGEEKTNLTELETVNIDIRGENEFFGNGTFENLNVSGSTGFHYEATVNMTEDKTSSYGSIRLTIGKGTYNETEGTLEVTIRPNCDDVVLWHHGGAHEVETLIEHFPGYATDLNQDIVSKIQYKDGKLSFQMNGTSVLTKYDLAAKGITNVKLEPGYCAQQCAGTISNIKIWEDAYDLLAGVTPATDASGNALVNSGSYKYTKEVNGKTYTFLSVETESYYVQGQSNVFRNDVLEWLKRELDATSKNSYVYVVSHAPIKETGVYGSDIAYDKNADWGTAKDGALTDVAITRSFESEQTTYQTSSSINSILKDYPQVVYFSGHTHYTNRLESSIMADNYTAINVAGVQAESYFDNVNQYMDSAKWNSGTKEYNYGAGLEFDEAGQDGYALYIEVDEAGNQRIQRVNITDSQIVSEVTLRGIGSDGVIENPNAADKAAAPTISAYYTDSVSITYNEDAREVTYGDAWVMAAPKADKSHLTPFTAEARKDTVIFNEGDFTLNEFKNTIGYGATLNFTFPTAYTEGTSKVIRYELALYDQDDNKISTEWIVGNWLNNTNGCAEGEDHTKATSLTYSHIYTEEQLKGVTSVRATLTAVSEFGATNTLNSTSDVSVDWGIQQPSASKANRNMFDGFTGDRIILAANTDENREKVFSVTESSDAFNSLTFTYDTANNTGAQAYDEIVFAVDKEKYEANSGSFANWSLLARNAKNMTDLAVKDTFVYEADFKIESGASNVFFTFRAPDGSDSNADFSGLLINEWGAELWLNREKIAWSGEFKLTDTNTHHLQIVSEPTCVTIWIDNTLVYYQQQYSFDLIGTIETDSTFVDNGDGTYTHTNPYNATITLESKLNSKKLIPAIAMYTQGAANFTVSNQALYLYGADNQCTEDDFGADESAEEKEYFDSSKVTVYDPWSTFSDYTIGENSITATQKDSGNGMYDFILPIEAATTDTIVTELEFKPTAMEYDGNDFWPNPTSGIRIVFRTDDTNELKLLMRTNGSQNLLHIVDGTHDSFFAGDMVNINQSVQIKIIANNEKVSIYVNDNLVKDNWAYNTIPNVNNYADFLSNNKPVFKFGMVNGTYEVTNISVRNLTAESKITGITPLTADNNLLITEGNIVSEANDFAVNGTNFYADMSNTEGTGTIYLFGKNNANSPLRSYDSFVLSSLVKTTGGAVKTDVATYGGKLLSYALEGAVLNVYKDNALIDGASINLNYTTGDYIRLTTVVSPNGFNIYADGIKVYSYEGTGAADYSVLKYNVSGAEARFLDTAVWYNEASNEYKTKLTEAIRTYESTLKGYYSDKKAEYDQQVDTIKKQCEEIKVLSIGHSYSLNSCEYLSDIAESQGVEMTIGIAYRGNCSLADHYEYLYNNTKYGPDNYEGYYKKYVPGVGPIVYSNEYTLKEMILDEDWDYIIFQECLNDAGNYDIVSAKLQTLYTAVKGLMDEQQNTDVQYIYHEIWGMEDVAYNPTDKQEFANYEWNSDTMYNAVTETSEKIAEEFDFRLLPNAEAFELARNTAAFDASQGGKILVADVTNHANEYGQYLAGITWFETITGYKVDKKTVYSPYLVSNAEADTLIDCAHQAVEETGLPLADAPDYRKCLAKVEKFIDDILANGKPVNSHVRQTKGIPTKVSAYSIDQEQDTGKQRESMTQLLDKPFTITNGSGWVVEADVKCVVADSASDQRYYVPRIGLAVSEGFNFGNTMIQGNIIFAHDTVQVPNNWQEIARISSTWDQDAEWHMKWTVEPGVGFTTTVTTVNGRAQIGNYTIPWSDFNSLSNLTTFSPYLFLANGDFEVSNICVNTLENSNLMSAKIGTEEFVDANSSVSSFHQENLYIYANASDAPDLQNGDVWYMEADLDVTDACFRMGFSLSPEKANEGNIMTQIEGGKNRKYYMGANGWDSSLGYDDDTVFGPGKWHAKYIVKWGESLTIQFTNDNGGDITHSVPWSSLGSDKIPTPELFDPSIIFVNTVAEISNIYVGYDLTPDIEKLNTASAKADTTKAEANVTNVSIQNIEEAQQEVAPVIATTAAYTKAEINAATKVLNDAIESTITGSPVSIFAENTGTATLYAAEGEDVYIGYLDATYASEDTDKGLDGQLYIAGWTDSEGQEVRTWTADAKPKIIDTKMLTVKYQGEPPKGGKYRVRFLSSVNDALDDYKRAGLVFSLTDEVKNPYIENGIDRPTTKVYKNVNARVNETVESLNAKTVYGNYSEYMYGRIINNIPEGQTFYVRAYVELLDGTIVYGVTREITVNASNLNIANQ